MNNDYFNDLNNYVEDLNGLASTLYTDKVNVNLITDDLVSTHVTAQDLNKIKLTLSTLIENVNDINSHLINADFTSESDDLTEGNSINKSLNNYLANDYIRKNQLIIDDHQVNDSFENLDLVYLRSKNIFVDGYKISTSSPYNLVSFNQLTLTIDGLSTNFLATLTDIKNDINNYISNLHLDGYSGGRYVDIDGWTINCTLSGDSINTDIDEEGHIIIKPAASNVNYVLRSVNGVVQWGTDQVGEDGATYSGGKYITISGANNSINCTLTEGVYTTIATRPNSDGQYPIDVYEASTEQKGVVQLVDSITVENKDSDDVAVTPAAIKNLAFGIEDHIFSDSLRVAIDGLPEGMMTTQSMGWIKYPNHKSTAYPGMCLAEAWGWTNVITMAEGFLKVPITKAYSYTADGDIELGSYCVFHRIIHVDLLTIGIKATDHVNLIYTLPFGPPTDDGQDVKGISMLYTHVKPLTTPTQNHNFQVFWKVLGYIYADFDEEWVSTTKTVAALITASYSNPKETKNAYQTTYKVTTKEKDYIPAGAHLYTADFWEGGATTARSITYTLTKIPNGEGKYTINGLRFLVRSISRYKYPAVYCSIVVIMDNVIVDMKNKTITGIKIGQKTGKVPSVFDIPNLTTVNEPTLHDPIHFGKDGETKDIVSLTSHNPDPGDDKDIITHAYFRIKYESDKIKFIGVCDSWSQGDDVVRIDSSGHQPATDIRFVDASNITCTYTTIDEDVLG